MEPNEPNEFVGDPGNAAPGTLLTIPTALVDAGLRIGKSFQVQPASRSWSVGTKGHTTPGTYEFMCTVHDFTYGELNAMP
jgi:hypothetical protein